MKHDLERVDSAYQPSGEFSLFRLPLMFAVSGAAAIAGGYLMGLALGPIGRIASSERMWLVIVELVVKALTAAAIGGGIAAATYWSSRFGKNRNKGIAVAVGLASGIAACFLTVGVSRGQGLGLLSGPVVLGALGVLPVLAALAGVGEPFCELHDRFMEQRNVLKISPYAASEAVARLKAGDVAAVVSMSQMQLSSNASCSDVVLDFCPACREGYLSIYVTRTSKSSTSNGSSTSESDRRLVCSERVDERQVETLLAERAGSSLGIS